MDIFARELATRLDEYLVVDIRRAEEWRQTGVIAGAYRLTFFDAQGQADPAGWLAALAEITGPQGNLVLVCRSGRRTRAILELLHKQTAYTGTRHLAGGMLGWLEAGLAVTPFAG